MKGKRTFPENRERAVLLEVFQKLSLHYGPQGWWPGETPFEVAVGTILVQHTNWLNAEKAVNTLKHQRLLNISALCEASFKEIRGAVQVAGLMNQKAELIRHFVHFLSQSFESDLTKLVEHPKAKMLLMSINGIGAETADSILLYAGGKYTVPIGSYTKRILERIGFVQRDYEQWQKLVLTTLPSDVETLKEFHAVFVAHGKASCRNKPFCKNCQVLKHCMRTKKTIQCG